MVCARNTQFVTTRMDHSTFAATIIAMGQRGESAYGEVDGQVTHNIPAQACRGRSGDMGSTFTGCINLRTGKMRFDCANDPAFFLEVELSKVPTFAASPEGATADAAADDFEQRRNISCGKK